MRIKQLRGLLLGIGAVAVAVAGLQCGGGASAGGGGGGLGRPTVRVGVVTEAVTGVVGITGVKVWGVVNTSTGLTKVQFVANASSPSVYELVNPPSGLMGFYVEKVDKFYQEGQWPYIGKVSGGVYQFPPSIPFDARYFAIAPLEGPFPAGVTDLGSVRLYNMDSPPQVPDFP
jgi:hypothetical protein